LPAFTGFTGFGKTDDRPSSTIAPLPAFTGFTGFSGGTSSHVTGTGFTSAVPARFGEDDEGDDGNEGEPILPPEKILRNEDDKDEQLYEVPCKLFRLNTESKEWGDLGSANLRITRTHDTGRKRLIVRNTMGKPLVNAYFYKNQKFETVKRNNIKFSAYVAEEGASPSLKQFLVRVKEKDLDNTVKELEESAAVSDK
jgi:hypothetical protein